MQLDFINQCSSNKIMLIDIIYLLAGAINFIIDKFEISCKIVSLQYSRMQSKQRQLEYAFGLVSKQNNQSVKEGQALINKLKSNVDYPSLLLTYLKNSPTFEGKLRAAIELKIWCDRYKNMEQFERNAYSMIIQDIKTNIVFAFLSFTDKIQQTLLLGVVSLTVAEQIAQKWKSLVPGLVTYATQNPGSTLKILQLMVEITNKYSYSSRSDPLYKQIIQVCNDFQKFLLNLTKYSVQNIVMNQNNPTQLKILQQEMILFYNLNYQDLHPEFEDNLSSWMEILNKVMKLPSNNESFFKCKGAALQSILLYASKYKDDVEDSIKNFMTQIWQLCANSSSDPQYDQIVTNSLKYFKGLLTWQDMKQSFASNLQNLISNLILPNLKLTSYYTQMFDLEIETFISYFFRNSQTSSRRASAIELLQSIVRNFNQNFKVFISNQISGFNSNMQMQCLLLTLVIESAPKGFRDVDGATSLWIDQDIIIFCYQKFIKNTLNTIYKKCQENAKKPIEKQINLVELLTCLRFIFYFRIYLPTQDLNLILKLCCGMYCQNQSLRQIVILVVNGIVTLKNGNFVMYSNINFYYNDQKLKQVAGDVLGMIAVYQKQTQELNSSLNKLFYSTVKLLKQQNQGFYDTYTGPIIKSMLCKTASFTFANVLPLFEAIGYLAFYLSSMKSPKSRDLQILTQQYFHQTIKLQSDMLNFSFQILSIFLRFNPGDISFYQNIYSSIIRAENWTEDNLSLVSSYLQYISAFITLNNDRIISDKEAFQQILTKLIELDHYELFYRLLKCILKITNLQGFQKYGYMHVLVKGTDFIATKSLQGRKIGLIFIFQITFDYSTQQVVNYLNAIENGFFQRTLLNNQDIIQTMQVLRYRKMMYGSICNALALKCFSSAEVEARMINLLIQNTTGRFRRQNLISGINEGAAKKQSTYQKLNVFKQIDQVDKSISLEQQLVLIQAYTVCLRNSPDLNNYISQKNLQRIKKLYEKHQNQQNR